MKKKIITIILVLALFGGAIAYYFYKGADNGASNELYSYVPGDYFVTNVKDSGSLLKTTVVLVLNTGDLTDELDDKQYVIRDTIIYLLRGLTEEDIKSDTIQDKLRYEIAEKLNEVLGIDSIVTVYFNDFVMQ